MGDVPWGAHFCNFYRDADDLVDSLVPFFKAGLETNEQCVWVTSAPLRADEARAALRSAVPDLAERERRGQIDILGHDEWYTRHGRPDAATTLAGWLQHERRARARGYDGLRLTGNTYWLERRDWDGFVDYESQVSAAFAGHHIVGLCSYCLGRCGSEDVLDVVRNHQFALARRGGEWEVLESASLKVAKAELRRANEELERRVATRTAELEQALQARDAFLAVAAHELKTPLTSLQLFVDGVTRASAREPLPPEALGARLGRIQDQCRRLDKLVTHLLDVSRTAAAPAQQLVREPLDLAALASDLAEHFAEELARAQCTLEVRSDGPVVGRFDRLRLEQVLTNLLSNAARYAPGARVTVRVAREGGEAVLSVADSGPGIAEQDHARIFERFAQASERHYPGGFGLGLWIVRQVAEAHGGAVGVRSRPGEGAVFTVRLPLEG